MGEYAVSAMSITRESLDVEKAQKSPDRSVPEPSRPQRETDGRLRKTLVPCTP